MFGLNWVDLIIILLLLISVLAGIKMGVINQVAVVGSGFAAFFLAGWLVPHLLPIHDLTLKTVITSNLVLLVSLYAAIKGFDASKALHWNFGHRAKPTPKLKLLDAALGCLPAIIGSLLTIWLLSVMFMRMPWAGLSNSIGSSRIVQNLYLALPPVPQFVAILDRQVNPNAQPYVFAQPKPSNDFNYSLGQEQQAAAAAQKSVTRITSFGCGGIVTGSGFAIAPDLIMTNAHVVAGVKRPIVKYAGRSYAARPVLFDVSKDVAVLRLSDLRLPFLKPAVTDAAVGTTVAILGFPDGNYAVSPGIIRNNLTVFGRNIYDVGLSSRQIYEIQTNVDFGSSGSPAVISGGQLAGMVFSKSTDPTGYAYALTASQLQPLIAQALKSQQSVSTGACVAN